MQLSPQQEAFQWQLGVWDRISQLYFREVDPRFAPVVAGTIRRAALKPGEKVLDLGTETAAPRSTRRRAWALPQLTRLTEALRQILASDPEIRDVEWVEPR